jgi:hypothetical protein
MPFLRYLFLTGTMKSGMEVCFKLFAPYTVDQIFGIAMPEKDTVFLEIVHNYHLTLNCIELHGQLFVGNREIELFGSKGNIRIAGHAAEDHLPFVGFNNISLVREFLQQPSPVSIAVCIKELPVDEYANQYYGYGNKPSKRISQCSLHPSPFRNWGGY